MGETNLSHNGTDLFVIDCDFNKEHADIPNWLKVNKIALNIKEPTVSYFLRWNHDVFWIYEKIFRISPKHELAGIKYLNAHIEYELNWKTNIVM